MIPKLILISIQCYIYIYFPLSRWQRQQQNLNPRHWDDEAKCSTTVLPPLAHNNLFILKKIFVAIFKNTKWNAIWVLFAKTFIPVHLFNWKEVCQKLLKKTENLLLWFDADFACGATTLTITAFIITTLSILLKQSRLSSKRHSILVCWMSWRSHQLLLCFLAHI